MQGRRHPAEALLSPRDEDREEPGQRRYGRRGADHVTPGPEQASRGGRGRGRARGGRSDRREASYSDTRGDYRGDQGQGAATQSSRGTKSSKSSAKDVAWNLFSAEAKVLPSCRVQQGSFPSMQRNCKLPNSSLHVPAETNSITFVEPQIQCQSSMPCTKSQHDKYGLLVNISQAMPGPDVIAGIRGACMEVC